MHWCFVVIESCVQVFLQFSVDTIIWMVGFQRLSWTRLLDTLRSELGGFLYFQQEGAVKIGTLSWCKDSSHQLHKWRWGNIRLCAQYLTGIIIIFSIILPYITVWSQSFLIFGQELQHFCLFLTRLEQPSFSLLLIDYSSRWRTTFVSNPFHIFRPAFLERYGNLFFCYFKWHCHW